MAREFSRAFYQSKEWKQTSRAYMTSKNYVCERCGAVGEICHHKKYLNPSNINDPYITLSFDNLECLCRECHGKEHELKRDWVVFDEAGNIAAVKDSGANKEYKQAVAQIDELLKKMTAQNGAGATKRDGVI